MSDSIKSAQLTKSPLVLLFLVSVLVIATLVVASNYFLRPQLEMRLRSEINYSFSQVGLNIPKIELLGRDVILNGEVSSKATLMKVEKMVKGVWGVRHIDNKIIIKQ